jgi:hypothetical protein
VTGRCLICDRPLGYDDVCPACSSEIGLLKEYIEMDEPWWSGPPQEDRERRTSDDQ